MKEAEEKEEVIASREGGTLAQTDISDTKEELMERREGHCLEPNEEEGGGIPNHHNLPNPVSIKPNAKMGEISQEGSGRCLILGVGKRNLGPIPNNVKPNPSLGGLVKEECQQYSSSN